MLLKNNNKILLINLKSMGLMVLNKLVELERAVERCMPENIRKRCGIYLCEQYYCGFGQQLCPYPQGTFLQGDNDEERTQLESERDRFL